MATPTCVNQGIRWQVELGSGIDLNLFNFSQGLSCQCVQYVSTAACL